jgi:glycosyltransferase involved in cell wall biosynthesis
MKDHANFLQAAVRIGTELDNVHFVLVGRDVTPNNNSLSGLVPRFMESRFHWLGERTDVTDLMCAMDVLASSSWSEGFPNVLGEAMACGVPCVATDVGDSARVLGEFGRIVPPCDSTSLSMAVTELLRLDPNERIELGTAARSRVEAKYSISKIAGQYISLYERLVSEARR